MRYKKERVMYRGLEIEMLHDIEVGRYFRSVVAGITWPSESPGALVVIGLEDDLRPPRRLHWIAERTTMDLAELLDLALGWEQMLLINQFYARSDQMEVLNFVRHRNRESLNKLTGRTKIFHFQDPPEVSLAGLVSYHIYLLREEVKPQKKGLFLGEKSRIPGALTELPGSIHALKDTDCPLVAAASYAVAALRIYGAYSMEPEQEVADGTDYNPLEF